MADAGMLRDPNASFCGVSHSAAAAGENSTTSNTTTTTTTSNTNNTNTPPGGGGAGDTWKEWDDRATCLLLDLYTQRYLSLQRGTLRSKEWQEVVDTLNAQCAAGKPVYTYNRCKNKIDSLKKTFKTVREKRKLGTLVKWKWYNRIERISAKSFEGKSVPASDTPCKRGKLSVDVSEQVDGSFVEFDANDGLGGAEDGMQALVSMNEMHDDPLMMRSTYCPPPPPPPAARFGVSSQHQSQSHWQEAPSSVPEGSSSDKGKKKRRVSSPTEHHAGQAHQQPIQTVAQMMIEALERMEQRRQLLEEKRMEMFKELEQKRTETQWEIAKMIVEASHQVRYFGHHQPNSPNPPDHHHHG